MLRQHIVAIAHHGVSVVIVHHLRHRLLLLLHATTTAAIVEGSGRLLHQVRLLQHARCVVEVERGVASEVPRTARVPEGVHSAEVVATQAQLVLLEGVSCKV